MKILFVYPRFFRHAQAHPELRACVPMTEYLGSPSLGIASIAAVTPDDWEVEFRDDRVTPADTPTDADLVAFSFFTAAATRAFELGRYFRGLGKPTVAGGIFPTAMPDIAGQHFDAVVEGEGEGVWAQVLSDVKAGRLQPRYRAAAACDLSKIPLPRLPLYFSAEGANFLPDDYPVQLSRGCPLKCHSCILPKSMGPALRQYPMDHVLGQLDQLGARGKRACLTEDTSWLPGKNARQLEALFDALIERGDAANVSYIGISMPMILAAPVSLLLKARQAGVTMFYLVGGFDPITMKAFTGKDPKALQRAYDAIARCREVDIEPYTSFLYGLDDDDVGTVDRMLEFASRAYISKAEFAIFTPYPGTPSYERLQAEGRITTTRWDQYNDANCVYQPKQMTADDVTRGYLRLWREFYADKAQYRDAPKVFQTIQF